MNGSHVVELREVRENAAPVMDGWTEAEQASRPGLAVRHAAVQVGVGHGGIAGLTLTPAIGEGSTDEAATDVAATGEGDAPVLAFVDPHTVGEPAGEMPRPAPERRRIRIAMRLSAERCRRLNLVSGFTKRSAQAVIVAALQDYLRDLVPCAAAALGTDATRRRGKRVASLAPGSQRSLRLYPHLYWRLTIAAQRGRRSVQSILTAALDRYLDTVAPAICAEVFDCLMGWPRQARDASKHSTPRPAHWRAQSGRPLGRRLLRNNAVRGAVPRLAG